MREMIEHPETIPALREYFKGKVQAHVYGQFERYVDTWKEITEVIDRSNTLQLYALHNLFERGNDALILPCDPTDHVAVRMSGIYVGIETDGYVHS